MPNDLATTPVPNPNPFGSVVRAATGGAVSDATVHREIAEVQAAVIMAKKYPRDQAVAVDRILNACSRPSLAEDAFYQYARGGTDIEGPSIRLAEAIAQNWGNMLAGVTILSSEKDRSECIAYAWDLETNFRDERRFTVKHWRDTKQGGYALKDERDIYELAANMGARRKRAAILAVIPSDVVEAAVRQCNTTLSTKMEITPDFIQSLIGAFEKFGVTKAHLEQLIQRRIDTLTPALAMRLKKIHTSLKDGMSEPKDWFDMTAPAAEGAAPATRTDQVKEKLASKRKPKDDAPSPQEPAAAAAPAAQESGAPEPITDEPKALLAMERAKDEAEAEIVIAQCKGQLFYPRIVNAFNERFAS